MSYQYHIDKCDVYISILENKGSLISITRNSETPSGSTTQLGKITEILSTNPDICENYTGDIANLPLERDKVKIPLELDFLNNINIGTHLIYFNSIPDCGNSHYAVIDVKEVEGVKQVTIYDSGKDRYKFHTGEPYYFANSCNHRFFNCVQQQGKFGACLLNSFINLNFIQSRESGEKYNEFYSKFIMSKRFENYLLQDISIFDSSLQSYKDKIVGVEPPQYIKLRLYLDFASRYIPNYASRVEEYDILEDMNNKDITLPKTTNTYKKTFEYMVDTYPVLCLEELITTTDERMIKRGEATSLEVNRQLLERKQNSEMHYGDLLRYSKELSKSRKQKVQDLREQHHQKTLADLRNVVKQMSDISRVVVPSSLTPLLSEHNYR